jgi:hypothetical protein
MAPIRNSPLHHRNPSGTESDPFAGPPSLRKPDPKPSHWPGYIQFLFVAGLTALFILLAVSMQRNHFLDGALDHRQQHVADDNQAQ